MAARHNQPHTSKDAHDQIIPLKWVIRRQVLSYAEMCGERGFTDWELCDWFQNHTSTYRTRRNELTTAGMIVPTEYRRRTPGGRWAVVWKVRENL